MMGARGPPPILPSNATPKSSAAASVSRELEDCSSTDLQHRFCAVAVDDMVDLVGECGCDFVGRIRQQPVEQVDMAAGARNRIGFGAPPERAAARLRS